MNHSDKLDQLLPALAQAVADMPDPKKNSRNPAFNNRFADLAEVLECASGPLAANGLLMTQTMGAIPAAVLVTTIWHVKTGQFLSSELPLVLEKNTSQAQGSSISYTRRYSIKALFGMVDVDDDGDAASGKPPSQPTRPAAASKPPPSPEPFDLAEEAVAAITAAKTVADLGTIRKRVDASGFTGEDAKRVAAAGKQRLSELKET